MLCGTVLSLVINQSQALWYSVRRRAASYSLQHHASTSQTRLCALA